VASARPASTSSCRRGLALLLPVLIFIGTATRRHEHGFGATRLVGATPRQVSMIAAVESAVADVAIGFGPFLLLDVPLAAISFTGQSFFPPSCRSACPTC